MCWCLLPWALPGTVVAVSIAEAYGQPNALTGSFILVGTFWILPVVYFLRFMPLVVRAVQASIEQLDRALEEAAGGAGRELVAKVLARALAAGCSGRAGRSFIGIRDRYGRIRGICDRIHPGQSAGFDRHCVSDA